MPLEVIVYLNTYFLSCYEVYHHCVGKLLLNRTVLCVVVVCINYKCRPNELYILHLRLT